MTLGVSRERIVLSAVVAGVLTCSTAVGATFTWTGVGATNEWTDPANWGTADYPDDTNDFAIVQGNNVAAYNYAGALAIDRLNLGKYDGSEGGELDVQSGVLAVVGASSDAYRDGNGTIRISGGTLSFPSYGQNIRFGHRPGSFDRFIMTDGVFTNAGRINGLGFGSMQIDVSGGTMYLNGTHGDWVSAPTGQTAVMNISGGTIHEGSWQTMRIAGGGANRNGRIYQSGGTVDVYKVDKSLRVGVEIGGDAEYHISGGVLNVTNDIGVGQASASNAVFHVDGSGADINIGDRYECYGRAVTRFTADENGVSTITCGGLLNLNAATDDALQVDVTQLPGRHSLVLFDYGSINGGFDAVEVTFGKEGALNEFTGTFNQPNDLSAQEYYLDYTTDTNVTLHYFASHSGFVMVVK